MTEAKLKDVKKRGKAAKKPSQMEELRICQENIARLDGEMSAWALRKERLLEAIIAGNPVFSKTKMQEKRKSNSDTYKADGTAIIRTPSLHRTLRIEEIRKTFPDFIMAHGTVTLGIADKILGQETVNKFCDNRITYRYEVQSLKTESEKVET